MHQIEEKQLRFQFSRQLQTLELTFFNTNVCLYLKHTSIDTSVQLKITISSLLLL
jgi:hypothetical protein